MSILKDGLFQWYIQVKKHFSDPTCNLHQLTMFSHLKMVGTKWKFAANSSLGWAPILRDVPERTVSTKLLSPFSTAPFLSNQWIKLPIWSATSTRIRQSVATQRLVGKPDGRFHGPVQGVSCPGHHYALRFGCSFWGPLLQGWQVRWHHCGGGIGWRLGDFKLQWASWATASMSNWVFPEVLVQHLNLMLGIILILLARLSHSASQSESVHDWNLWDVHRCSRCLAAQSYANLPRSCWLYFIFVAWFAWCAYVLMCIHRYIHPKVPSTATGVLQVCHDGEGGRHSLDSFTAAYSTGMVQLYCVHTSPFWA